jgi:sugar phosphate isomerase/epimerase
MIFTEPQKKSQRSKIAALRLGVRAHDFGRLPADALAARIAAKGFSCVQLALNKAIAGLNLHAGDLNSDLARQIGGAFARRGVGVEVLGCYINPIHPDLPTRRKMLDYFKEHMRFARDFGCGIVALESGSLNADYSPHPANHGDAAFDEMSESIGELVAVAEQFGVMVGFEAVHCHTVSSAQKMRRVLDVIGSKSLRVVFDAANLLSPQNVGEQTRIIAEALELLGDDIAVIHAKDFVLENGVMRTVPAGRGKLCFAPVWKFLRASNCNAGILLEKSGERDAPDCAKILREQFKDIYQ